MDYREKNSDLKRLAETPPYTLDIDWKSIEKNIILHKNVKNFFSRMTGKQIDFYVQIDFRNFVQTPENSGQYSNWLDDHSGIICANIDPLFSLENMERIIKHRFEIGGESNRIHIGNFYLDIGDVSIVINNDNGNIEWCDFGYGYFEVYEENPFAVMSTDVQKFLDMLLSNEKTENDFVKQNHCSEDAP